jgi:hypothetical protein
MKCSVTDITYLTTNPQVHDLQEFIPASSMTSVTLRVWFRGVIFGVMSNIGPFARREEPDASAEKEKADAAAKSPEAVPAAATETKPKRGRFPDMQSAMRFPIKLPVSVKSKSGESHTETQNISANGVLFQMVDSEMPVGSMVDFTISLPADVVGAASDVRVDCRGRVVRSFEDAGRRGVGVVIDEYRFDRAERQGD